ncbi:FAD-dependent monooxygenase [Paenibacillus faecalis]|uniref:FAD-dependent monooxygenase n=1 Tax=Paenibacillus faecalis TaxID=2079532 RepID=UPI000D0EB6CD|nr:FAD-dependent monooxygenase [Paenibacillus faecalis]
MNNNIVIVGGGIAGLCAAIAFQHLGIQVKVYERSPEPTVAGAGIIIAPNALQALEPYGIAAQIIRAGKASESFHLLSEKGEMLTKLTVPSGSQKMYSIHRKDLHHLLLSALHPGTVEWGKECRVIQQDDHGVRVHFADGSIAEGSILVAADGIHSGVRKQLLTKDIYRYAGYTCWRGVVSSDGLPGLSEHFIETWGTKGRFGIVPLPHHQVYWYALVNAPPNEARYANFTAQDLLPIFEDYHMPIPGLLKKTEPHQIIHRDIADIVPLKRFYEKRIVFIGDAAHAITPNVGQGACQAIEDARVLADCIEQYSDIHEAFVQYDIRRRKRAVKISNLSWMLGKIAQSESSILTAGRNWIMRHTPKSISQNRVQDLYKFHY